jgi:hypothetical protein
MAIICSPWITLENGEKLHADTVGKIQFCFEVDEKVHPKQMTLPFESDT